MGVGRRGSPLRIPTLPPSRETIPTSGLLGPSHLEDRAVSCCRATSVHQMSSTCKAAHIEPRGANASSRAFRQQNNGPEPHFPKDLGVLALESDAVHTCSEGNGCHGVGQREQGEGGQDSKTDSQRSQSRLAGCSMLVTKISGVRGGM